VIFAREEWFALQHLGKDTASTPDINLYIILLPCKHDFRCSVVSCRHVASHLWVLNPSQSEVANLEIAVFVDQNIGGLQITVNDASGVNVFQASLNLISHFA